MGDAEMPDRDVLANELLEVVSDWDFPRLPTLIRESQAMLASKVVEVVAAQTCHSPNSRGRVNQNPNDSAVSKSNRRAGVNAGKQSAYILNGDFRCLSLHDLKPFPTD